MTYYIRKDDTIGSTPSEGATGFTVSSQGLLRASNAVIFGTLRSGKIESCSLNSTTLYLDNGISYIQGNGTTSQWCADGASIDITTSRYLNLTGGFGVSISGDTDISGTLDATTIYENGTKLSSKYASSSALNNCVKTNSSTTITSAQVTMGTRKAADNARYYFNDNATGRFNVLRYTDLAMIKSSREYKTDIDYKDTEYWHNGLMNVKPCTFRYKYGDCKKTKIGVIAEDLIEYMPELVLLDENGKCDTVYYIDFIIPLVSEVQRLNKEIDRLENLIKGAQA